jgi:hypothetical protein
MNKDERSFTIVDAAGRNGCPTKFSRGDYSGRYISKSPSSAASKALTELCSSKRIKGQCTLYIAVQETTAGSNKKIFYYHAKRIKLDEPIEITKGVNVYYQNKVYSVDENEKPKCGRSAKSSGRMMRHKAKKTKKPYKANKSKKTKKVKKSKKWYNVI